MITIVFIWGLIILFIIYPSVAHDGAMQGAQLFLHALLPYLLPYIILTQWLLKIPSQASASSRWKRYAKAYILGSFGGFPVGAVTVTEMYKRQELSRAESTLLLAVCHAPGPMFIIGFIGLELFGDLQAGWKLLLALHCSNILFFIFAKRFFHATVPTPSKTEHFTLQNVQSPLLEAIKDSSSVIMLVATTVIFFSALGTVLTTVITNATHLDLGITQTIALALFEMTSGVQAAHIHLSSFSIFPYIVASIVALNGLSIHIQVLTIARNVQLSILPYITARLFAAVAVPTLLLLFSL